MTNGDGSGLVFVRTPEPAELQIWINFGIFAGRTATLAETDRLAQLVLDLVPAVTIVSEDRHELGGHTEASVHQVRIEVVKDRLPDDPAERQRVEERLVERADHWARACLAARAPVNP